MAEDSEVLAFTRLVNSVRRSFSHSDEANNPGFIESARIDSVYPTGTSVKLVVYNGVTSDPAKSSVVKFCPDGEFLKKDINQSTFMVGAVTTRQLS